MKKKWTKLKLLFNVEKFSNKLFSHASNPVVLKINNNIFRVFYSGRDKYNRSSIGYFDFNIDKLQVENNINMNSIFDYGKDDSYYSHGVSIGTIYEVKNELYLLFMGWKIKENEHWRGDIGRLKLTDSLNNLYIENEIPLLGIDNEDLVSLSYPWVIFENGIYKMWYGSTISWTSENGEMIHVIKYATSINGLNWDRHGIAIPYEIGIAQAFSRPTVIVNKDGYHMWYSYRSGVKNEKYKIGYSFSTDGLVWERRHNDCLLEKSHNGWDSEMVCYPCVFEHNSNIYMLYNGNEFGKSGIGIAILQ
jgi:hypothetical protein